jgi:hypothetical protein
MHVRNRNGEMCITRSFIICVLLLLLLGSLSRWMTAGTCSMHEGNEKFLKNFVGKTSMEETAGSI